MAEPYASKQATSHKNNIENIAVIGAGGNVGSYIVEGLLKTGKHKVTAITRPESKSDIVQGATVKKVDYSTDDLTALVDVLRGHDAMIITMAVVRADEDDPQKKLIQAAAQAGVSWVMPSEFGPDGTNEKVAKDTLLDARAKPYRELIEQLGMNWVNLACSFWYEYSLVGGSDRYGFDFEDKTVLFYDDGTTKINTTTWPQIGRAVGALFSLKVSPEDDKDDARSTLSNFKNKYCYVSSFRISQQDMLDSVLRVTEANASDWKVSKKPAQECYEESKKELFAGNRAAFGRMLYSRAFYDDKGFDYESTHGLDNDILGLQQEDLDAYTKAAIGMDAKWASKYYYNKK